MKPCSNCPFLKVGGVGLTKGRRREIATALRAGKSFHCHKTVDYSGDRDDAYESGGRITAASVFCAGALATMNNAEPNGAGCMANQSVRILARLGFLNPDTVAGGELCHKSLTRWVQDAEGWDR
ncbi:MAG TPA: hypothetical protein VFB71_12275 [Ramlibacter sp.]|nr:hypothetical protein [Ramlibacter sp.]